MIESLLVMLDQLAGATSDVVDRNAVSAETAGDVHVLHPCERVEEIGEGVTFVEGVHEVADVRCCLLQDVVAGEHDVGVVEVEADVARRVAGGVDNAEAAAGECDDLVVGEKAVGSGLGAHGRLARGRQFECIAVGFRRSSAFHVLEDMPSTRRYAQSTSDRTGSGRPHAWRSRRRTPRGPVRTVRCGPDGSA